MVLAEKAPAAAAAAVVDPAEPAPEEGAEVIEEAPPPPLWEVEEKALPFMPVPDNILNYEVAGNYGFDPLGFTDWVKVRLPAAGLGECSHGWWEDKTTRMKDCSFFFFHGAHS